MSLIKRFRKLLKVEKLPDVEKTNIEQNIEKYDSRHVFQAISNGHYLSALKMLKKLDTNMTNEMGATPLISLVQNCSEYRQKEAFMVLDYLLCEKATVDATDIYGKTAYDYAKENGLQILKETIIFSMNVRAMEVNEF